MNPVVLIATHNRVDITKRNIESILRQSVKPSINVICSDHKEANLYRSLSWRVIAIDMPNRKLGERWQNLVSMTRNDNCPIIITGSDDILGDGFIENACRLIKEGNHFIGLRQWWQHKDGKAYKCQYVANNNMPLGGGRVYSSEMLKRITYQVFDPNKDKHLDDLGFEKAMKSGLKCLILEDPEKEGLSIHAIKGNWKKMNEFTLKHPNIRHISTEKSEKVLPNFFK